MGEMTDFLRKVHRHGTRRTDDMGQAIDRDILSKAQRGDKVAMNTLLAVLAPKIEHQLLRYPVSDDDRKDLLQATLIQVVRRIGSFRGDSSFSTWLFRVTANEALMMMRSQRRVRAKISDSVDDTMLAQIPDLGAEATRADVGIERQERDGLVNDALSSLPTDYRDIVLAHYQLDLGLQEIADRFALTESAVRSRLHRARSRLRSLLEELPMWNESPAAA